MADASPQPMTPREALDVTFHDFDREKAVTFRKYFRDLLYELVREGECFSGKRPFGNSGWEWGLLCALAEEGVVPSKPQYEGSDELEPADEGDAREFLLSMVEALADGDAA